VLAARAFARCGPDRSHSDAGIRLLRRLAGGDRRALSRAGAGELARVQSARPAAPPRRSGESKPAERPRRRLRIAFVDDPRHPSHRFARTPFRITIELDGRCRLPRRSESRIRRASASICRAHVRRRRRRSHDAFEAAADVVRQVPRRRSSQKTTRVSCSTRVRHHALQRLQRSQSVQPGWSRLRSARSRSTRRRRRTCPSKRRAGLRSDRRLPRAR